MLALGLAGLGAGRLDGRVDDLGVSLGGNHCLCNKNLVTDGAVLALGLAGLGAGRLDGRVGDLGVALGGDFLRLGLAAPLVGAGVGHNTLVLAGRRSGDLAGVPAVSLGGNLFQAGEGCAADGALGTRCQAGFGAGGGLLRYANVGVAGGSDRFGLGLVADRAGKGPDTRILAGGGSSHRARIPLVSLGGDGLLCNEYLVTDGAVPTLGQTRLRAGSLDCRVDDLGMALGGNHFLCNDDLVADRAVLALGLAGLGAGRCNCQVSDLGVALGGNLFQAGEGCAADGALRTRLVAGLGAGGRLLRHVNAGVAGCTDCFGLGLVADRAGIGLDTGVQTGRRGRDLALIPAVSLGGNNFLLNEDFVADRAVLTLGQASLGTGRLDCRVDDLGVSLGGDGLAVCDLFVTILAVGIAGVAILSAGGLLGISHFRVLMCASFAAPDAVDIVDNIASVGGRSFGVGAVKVVQLGGGDGDRV